ncbi:histidine phosphatase family protein [Arthrobacter sp. NPDC093139]|uniref:histidine phosphatase family protein n=1 Tax=Arthrobacter sp. NPDC093139 TaxID=3363945 RepID=UPI0037FC88BB
MVSPTLIGIQSANALGLDAERDSGLRPANYGRWNGLTLDVLPPDAVAEWRNNPEFRRHGGESVLDIIERMGVWLAALPRETDVIVVTHAEIIRAAVAATTGNIDDYWNGPHCTLRGFEAHTLNL